MRRKESPNQTRLFCPTHKSLIEAAKIKGNDEMYQMECGCQRNVELTKHVCPETEQTGE